MPVVTPSVAGADRTAALYTRHFYEFPMLTPEVELLLARRWRQRGDVAAMQTLVTPDLCFVVWGKCAGGVRPSRRPYRAFRVALTLLLGALALAACSAVQIHTQNYGYGSQYYQLGRD
jgi:hypothetical protein